MERVAGIEPVAPDPVGAQSGHRLIQLVSRPRQHGVGAVVRGDRQARELVGQTLDAHGVGENRDHPTARGQAAEEATALGHQQRAVGEAEHARDAGRRVLADAVTKHHVGLESPRLPEAGQTHLDREQGRLRIGGLPQGVFALSAVHIENDVQQWLFENVGHRLRATIQRLGEYRLCVVQLPGHSWVLAALAGEQPRGLGRVMTIRREPDRGPGGRLQVRRAVRRRILSN